MAKILIVEDNDELREFFVILLNLNKHAAIAVSTKKEIVTQIELLIPDLIIMDVMLGNEDGREICKEIKKSHKNIKILLMSASPKLLQNYKDCNADGTIEKPFELKSILDKIESLLEIKLEVPSLVLAKKWTLVKIGPH
ncbi:response regulator transcription factor [Ferruginibacter albus]|uniref:response regulator transcription factor n=1 Tax=Ferruginibacter albus TaxID=2875540 RepID=UPI001CC77AFB|nr:response regulator [Ferruginibacter albus]UAY53130.1 response regulator [Ferruginibacter albus]